MHTVQVNSDWCSRGTAAYIEAQVGNLKLAGPGLYLADGDTGLLVPADPSEDPFEVVGDADTVWVFHCYTQPFERTILWHITDDVPIVSDKRTPELPVPVDYYEKLRERKREAK